MHEKCLRAIEPWLKSSKRSSKTKSLSFLSKDKRKTSRHRHSCREKKASNSPILQKEPNHFFAKKHNLIRKQESRGKKRSWVENKGNDLLLSVTEQESIFSRDAYFFPVHIEQSAKWFVIATKSRIHFKHRGSRFEKVQRSIDQGEKYRKKTRMLQNSPWILSISSKIIFEIWALKHEEIILVCNRIAV